LRLFIATPFEEADHSLLVLARAGVLSAHVPGLPEPPDGLRLARRPIESAVELSSSGSALGAWMRNIARGASSSTWSTSGVGGEEFEIRPSLR
jgi:hypothetical protein